MSVQEQQSSKHMSTRGSIGLVSSDVRLFVKDVVIFIGMLSCVIVAIAVAHYAIIGNSYMRSYNAALLDKMDRLAKIDGRKIVLIGDSSVPFGIDSKILEKEFGYEVVDLGLYRELGNAFAEDCCLDYVGEGDIVVILHSMMNDADDIPAPDIAWLTVEYHRNLWDIVRMKDMPEMARAYPNYMKNTAFLKLTGKQNAVDEDSSYQRNAFNEYGDIEYRPASGQWSLDRLLDENARKPNSTDVSDECVQRLNLLNKYVDRRGASLVVASAPIFYHDDLPDEGKWRAFHDELEDRMDCDVISDYTDYFYPENLFYNSITHMTDEGARIRTRQLAKDIEKWKEEP